MTNSCEQGVNSVALVFQEERSNDVTSRLENVQVYGQRSESSELPYPIQRETPSIDENKLLQFKGRVQPTGHPRQASPATSKNNSRTGVKLPRDAGYVDVARSPVHRNGRSPGSTVVKETASQSLPSHNLLTDAAPSDSQPQQETGASKGEKPAADLFCHEIILSFH